MNSKRISQKINVLPFVINPKVTGQCGRCQMIGVDQDTGAKTKEPLMSLSAYRAGKVSRKPKSLLVHKNIIAWKYNSLIILYIFRWLLVFTWPMNYQRVPLQQVSSLVVLSYSQSHTDLKVVILFIYLGDTFIVLSGHCCTAHTKDHLSDSVGSCSIPCVFRWLLSSQMSFSYQSIQILFYASLFWWEMNKIFGFFSPVVLFVECVQ